MANKTIQTETQGKKFVIFFLKKETNCKIYKKISKNEKFYSQREQFKNHFRRLKILKHLKMGTNVK